MKKFHLILIKRRMKIERRKYGSAKIQKVITLSQVLFLLGIVSGSSSSLIPSKRDLHEAILNSAIDNQLLEKNAQVVELEEDSAILKEPYSFNTSCSDEMMRIMGNFDKEFSGRIYAKDYADEPLCGVRVPPSKNFSFHLPLGQCGIEMMLLQNSDEHKLQYEVSLYIQYSSFLQQVIDEELTVSCNWTKPETYQEEKIEKSRQGRRMKESGVTIGKNNGKIGGEGVLEIFRGKDPTPKTKDRGPVPVGEDLTLVISTKVPRGYDARVVNCSTHDGSGDGSRNQPILDSAGCTVDESLVPNLRRRRLPPDSSNQLPTLHFATFQAFKFPERDHVHVECSVAFCQGPCPHDPCDTRNNHFGPWRGKYGRAADALIQTARVRNAIQVLSPDIDPTASRNFEKKESRTSGQRQAKSGNKNPASSSYTSSSGIPQSKSHSFHQSQQNQPQRQLGLVEAPYPMKANLCLSPGTLILALVVLGLVLVISVIATLWFALKRSEPRTNYSHQDHKSVFSNHTPPPYYRFSQW